MLLLSANTRLLTCIVKNTERQGLRETFNIMRFYFVKNSIEASFWFQLRLNLSWEKWWAEQKCLKILDEAELWLASKWYCCEWSESMQAIRISLSIPTWIGMNQTWVQDCNVKHTQCEVMYADMSSDTFQMNDYFFKNSTEISSWFQFQLILTWERWLADC